MPHLHLDERAGDLSDLIEPTFYLGGQPYVYDEKELKRAGPELVEMALRETYRASWQVFVEFQQGRIAQEEFETRTIEMILATTNLRDILAPDQQPLLMQPYFRRRR